MPSWTSSFYKKSPLPQFLWQGFPLNQLGEPPQEETTELNAQVSLLELLPSIHPHLTFADLCSYYHHLQGDEHFPWADFFEAYQLQWNDQLKKTVELFQKCPLEFRSWCGLRKVMPRDLSALLALQDVNQLEVSLKYIAASLATRNEGSQFLELAVELSMMENLPQLEEKWSFKQNLEALQKQRYPLTRQKNESLQQHLLGLPWPKKWSPKMTRLGDQSVLELRLQLRQKEDLKLQIKSLQSVYEKWEDHETS